MPSKKNPNHPLYIEMIKTAIGQIKDRKGCSKQAILKYIQENYQVGDNARLVVNMTLKRNVASGKIIQTSGIGSNGRFKIPSEKTASSSAKKPVKKSATKAKPKQPSKKVKTPKKKATPKKKSSPKKSANKKTGKKSKK